MRKSVIIGISLFSGFAVLGAVMYAKYCLVPNSVGTHILLINGSSQQISRGEVLAVGEKIQFGSTSIGKAQEVVLSKHGEGGYVVNVEFISGTRLSSGELGYLTSGLVVSDVVTIEDKKISLTKSEAR